MKIHCSLACHSAALLSASLLALAPPALALTRGASPQGWALLDGGVGRSEVESMEAERGRYSLWIITAARVSGAYLADVDISITNDKGAKVFERRLEGPWLMIDLPLGRYEVQARLGQESLKRVTTIHRGDHHQMVFHFGVDADVLPK
ncbi:MAG TPA: hypothetical protein VIP05_04940 [Burkholderiaceae bacterium]